MLLEDLLADLDGKDRIDLDRLPAGTKIIAKTENSVYNIEIVNGRQVNLQGGQYFPFQTAATIAGSTWWDGSTICVGHICQDMCMEIYSQHHQPYLITSRVKAAKIIGTDGKAKTIWNDDKEWLQDGF